MSDGPGPHAGRRLAIAALLVALAAEVVLLLVIPVYVTVDGAVHVGGAALIRDVLRGDGALHLQYVEFALFPPAPNILPELGLTAAMLVLEPGAAEKLLQVAYVVSLPLAMLYAIRGVAPDRQWLALLAVPMTFTFAFQYGFYDFSFGVAVFLVAAGFAWRHRDRPSWRHGTVFALLALALYLTHAVPFLELAVFMAVTSAVRVAVAWRDDGAAGAARVVRGLVPFLAAMVPTVVLVAYFFLATRSALPSDFLSLPLQVVGVLGLALGLATTDRLELVVAAGLALTLASAFVAAGARRLRSGGRALREGDALLAYAVTAAALAFVAPASVQSGGSYIPERLALFPVYGLALWLATADLPRLVRRLLPAAWLALAAVLFALRLPTTLQLSDASLEYQALAGCVAPRATMIQVNLARVPAGSLGRTDPLTLEASRVAAATRGHDLSNFEGTFPFFLFRNLPSNDPSRLLATSAEGFYGVPPAVDLETYNARGAGAVDYVFVFGRRDASAEILAAPGWTSVRDALDAGYRQVAVSGNGLVEAWERRDEALMERGDARRATAAGACPT